MRFTINPITDEFDVVGLGSGTFIETITGNTGGAVGPDGSGNLSLLGNNATGITVVGSPGVSTLSITGLPSSTTQVGTTRYSTNAEAAAQSSTTSALTPSNITSMFSTTPLPASQGGTGRSSPAAHSLLVTNGSSAFTVLGTASNGQLPIGSIGSDPVLANITSSGGTITVTNGPGTINIDLVGGTVAVDSFSPDSGTDPVVPTAIGLVNDKGSGSITTVGSLNTITTQLTGLTNHAVLVGAGTTTITKIAATANTGAVLQNNSAADPSYSTATYPSTTTVSQLLYSSATNTVTGLATANRAVITTNATGVPVATALATDGQLIIGSTAGVPAAASLTAGSGITITPGSNSITIAVTAGTTVVETLTGNSGGAISPTAGNINTLGTGSVTVAGAGSTLTTQLTGLTNHALQIGAGTATLTQLGAGTTGQVLQTNTTADPTWSTATYPSTTTVNQLLYSSATNVVGGVTAVIDGVLISNHATGVPSWLANGTAGFVLTAQSGAPPAWAAGGGTVSTLTGNSGGAISPSAGNIGTVGTGSITIAGSGSTLTTQLTGLTNHNVLIGAGTATITNVAPSATSGVPLISQGASADPVFGTAVVAGGGTGATTLTGVLTGNGTSAITGGNISASSVNGVTSGSAPGAGIIGERISSFVNSSSPVTLSNGVTANITNIVLTAGCWDISCLVELNTSAVATSMQGGIGTISATLPANSTIGDQSFYNNVIPVNGAMSKSLSAFRANISGSTTYYLVIQAAFASGSSSAYGRISGTRVG